MRCHDGKAQLIVACKAQLMSGLEPYELAHISSPGAAHLGPMWTRLAWSPRRQRELEDKGGGKSRNGLKEIEERKFSQFFCDPNCDQISPNCVEISSQLDPAQIAKKIACNSGQGQRVR